MTLVNLTVTNYSTMIGSRRHRHRGVLAFGCATFLWGLAFSGQHSTKLCADEPAATAPASASTGAATAKPPVNVILLAIDDVSLPLRKNVGLYLTKPTVRPEPVLIPSPLESNAPDNLAAHFYGTVLHDGGKFRMWYYACHRGKNPDWPPRMMQQVAKKPGWLIGVTDGYEIGQGPLCYAESADGITWTKPALGQVKFKGNSENNAIALPHTIVSSAAVIRDDTDANPDRRYKMAYQFFPDQTSPAIPEYGNMPSMACAVSPDGIKWTVTVLPYVNQFVEHCSFIQHAGRYIVHYQVFPGSSFSGVYSEGGGRGGRTGVTRSTYDFDRWPDFWELAFALPEPSDAAQRGTGIVTGNSPRGFPQVHLGVGAASLGNVCVGVYGLWHDSTTFADITCDLGLVISNDGIRFREPMPGYQFIKHTESLATPIKDRASNTILCQGNGILNVGDKTLIYHGRWRNVGQKAEDITQHYRAEVALATLPRDRWGALGLNPGARAGSVCSALLTVPEGGCEVLLNADAARGMRVELFDEQLQPVEGFSGANSGTIDVEGGLDCLVKWPKGELASLAGKQVRLLVHLTQTDKTPPRLYAVSLRAKGTQP